MGLASACDWMVKEQHLIDEVICVLYNHIGNLIEVTL